MQTKNVNRRVCLLIFTGFYLLTTACSGVAPQVVEVTRVVPQTILVTQVVTPAPTETLAASLTPTASETPKPTFTPTQVVYPTRAMYFPIKDCAPSHLKVGDQVIVTYGGRPNAIRYSDDVHSEINIAGYAKQGDILNIMGGPECSWGWLIWLVKTSDGLVGWTPESDGNSFWLIQWP